MAGLLGLATAADLAGLLSLDGTRSLTEGSMSLSVTLLSSTVGSSMVSSTCGEGLAFVRLFVWVPLTLDDLAMAVVAPKIKEIGLRSTVLDLVALNLIDVGGAVMPLRIEEIGPRLTVTDSVALGSLTPSVSMSS